MSTRRFVVRLFTLAAAMLPAAGSFAACDLHSGAQTAALVELYTSEGCSSCPPADSQLQSLAATLAPAAEVVPLALHVDYWDELGWTDPYAQSAFDARQSWLVQTNHQDVVYTPQFFVGGTEVRAWQSDLRDQVRRLNATTAVADLRVQAKPAANGALALRVEARAPRASGAAVLYVALTEDGLSSEVSRGENRGATLTHDHVVRVWLGPTNLQDGVAVVEREIALPHVWRRSNLNVVAFVQNAQGGGVLQALTARQCAKS